MIMSVDDHINPIKAKTISLFPKVRYVFIHGYEIVVLEIDEKYLVSIMQISNTVLKDFSSTVIHNRRVALGKKFNYLSH